MRYIYLITIILILKALPAHTQTITDAVDFNYKRGFYTDSFQLILTTRTSGAIIRYTLNGSKPSLANGQDYSVPIKIKSNTLVRAYAHAGGLTDSKIKTHTYIFPEQVIRQKNTMLQDYGYDYSTEKTGKVFWTEEMDPGIVDADEYKDDILSGLTAIPTLSIVMTKADLWGENGIHWGNNLENTSDAFERECSIEMIYPEGYKGNKYKNWQENAGIKIQGGGGRWHKGTYDHKQSFTLVFKKIYGAGKLKNEIFADAPHGSETAPGKYDRIILRSGHNKGWGSTWDREKTVYTRDQLGRDLQILMSGFGSRGTFVHLYLNGKYWGLYNPCERPDNNYLANQFGGESEDYFYAKGKDSRASDDRVGEPGQSKSRFFEACSKDYSKMSFDEMQNWVMVDQSIACFLVYGYSNPGDGPQYYYGNNNNPKGPVVWTPWDIEDAFGGGSRRTGPPSVTNMIDDKVTGDNGFKAFWTNVDFRMRFNDLVYKHFFNDGVMTDENVIAAWDNLNNFIYKPIVCESARWGDERGVTMDRNQEWDAARLAVRNDLKGRANDFITKLKTSGYFTTLPAPKYLNAETLINTSVIKTAADFLLTISREGTTGNVYYTTDGSDPRAWDLKGSVSASAITVNGSSAIITINKSTIVKARTKNGSDWSPMHEIKILSGETTSQELVKADKTQKLQLYPNPVSDILYLSKDKEYTLYSSLGILVLNGKGSEVKMNNLPNGLYFIIIDNVTYKVLKRD
ncbi:MAG: FN3 associated domain-containing protein [Bacteroidales bacterium]